MSEQHASETILPVCRFCARNMTFTFVDLGMSPLCQTQIPPSKLNCMEPFYPLHVHVCEYCLLVQLDEYVAPESIFTQEYPYFSSYSDSWVEHARRYRDDVMPRFKLGGDALVVEIASNDGYLLQHFVAAGIPVLGVEPSGNVAQVAREKGVRTEESFFGKDTAQDIATRIGNADLLLGNNVLAHVPDINDFVAGMKCLLAPAGVITMEFPHLMRLMEENQFDTIYHEHFSYLSFGTVKRVFDHHGLDLFDVEELPTHGGSLRIFACHSEDGSKVRTGNVSMLLEKERDHGLASIRGYAQFSEQVANTKRNILRFLIDAKQAGKSIVGYGAPGKGNTLLNYCGIRTDFLDYTVDRNPFKQGTHTPGSRIPIYDPERIRQTRPDYVFILPWNLKDEIISQTSYIREWGGQWVTPIPDVQVHD